MTSSSAYGPLMLTLVPEFVLLGLVVGGIYALFALGLTLIFGVMGVVNVAHGELFALGAYATVLAMTVLSVPSGLAAPAAAAGVAGATVIVYWTLVAPAHRRTPPAKRGNATLVLTLGLSIVIQNALLAIAGADYYTVPPFVSGATNLLGVYVANQRLLVLGVAGLLTGVLFGWLTWTRTGLAVRAVVQNPQAAEAVGINLSRVRALTWAIAGAMAGLAGALVAPVLTVFPHVGFALTIKAFAVVVIAGMGSLGGACVAAYSLGVLESLATLVISSEYRDVVSYSVMLLVLVARPQGLFGSGRGQ